MSSAIVADGSPATTARMYSEFSSWLASLVGAERGDSDPPPDLPEGAEPPEQDGDVTIPLGDESSR